MAGGTWLGYSASTGSTTTGWNDVVSYCPDMTMTTGDVTFATLRDSIWEHWTTASNTIIVDDCGTATAKSIWRSWNAMTSSTSITIDSVRESVWRFWIDSPDHTRRPIPVQYGNHAAPTNVVYAPPPPTRLQVLKEKLRSISVRRQRKERGLDLLRSIVTAEQWRDFRRYGSVREVGEQATYEVGCGWIGHVYELSHSGEPLRKLCVQMGVGQAGRNFTKGDRIAAVLLALRNDEEGTVRLAGKHRWMEHEKARVKARRGHLVVVAA